ncbi:cathepsin B [Trichoplusia ni ascovirus 6b]|nr:cathepsin B [Trichoplusia ni ascovirus 6b]
MSRNVKNNLLKSRKMRYNTDITVPDEYMLQNDNTISELFKFFTRNIKISQGKKRLPDEWDWTSVSATSSSEMNDVVMKKKAIISGPKTQHLCGSCWAFATSSLISDTIVISGLSQNINSTNVSATVIMKLSNSVIQPPESYDCSGGNSIKLLNRFHSDNIEIPASTQCTTYKWCSSNRQCTQGESSSHLQSDEDHSRYLSSLIPKEAVCIDATTYRITSASFMGHDANSLNDNNSAVIFQNIKNHIIQYGSVLANILLHTNFTKGLFAQLPMNDGIYLENVNYTQSMKRNVVVYRRSKLNDTNIVGTHSVVVVGWGKANVIDENGLSKRINYWKCRNSWGTSWGDGGYFKIAMYPDNKRTFIGGIINAVIDQRQYRVGGVMLIQMAKINDNVSMNIKQDGTINYLPSSSTTTIRNILSKEVKDANALEGHFNYKYINPKGKILTPAQFKGVDNNDGDSGYDSPIRLSFSLPLVGVVLLLVFVWTHYSSRVYVQPAVSYRRKARGLRFL